MYKVMIMGVAALALLLVMGFGGIYFLSEKVLSDVQRGPAFDLPVPTDAASVEHGRHIARTRGCFGCHGQQLEGRDFGGVWDWPDRAIAPNLSRYVRQHDAATLEAAIRQGIGANGKALLFMPSFNFARLSDADMATLIGYLQSVPEVENPLPQPRLGWAVRLELLTLENVHVIPWVKAVPPLKVDASSEPQRALGEYLAMTMCNECHGLDVRGQTQFGYNPDLSIVASISREQFETIIETGIGVGGRELGLMQIVGPDRFAELADEEVDALYVYLSSLANEPVPEGVFWRPVD